MNESFENSAEKAPDSEALKIKLDVILEEVRNISLRPGFEDIIPEKKEEAREVFEELLIVIEKESRQGNLDLD